MSVVLIEGPDGCGKTTLAHQLLEPLNAQYTHEGPPPETGDLFRYYADGLDHGLRVGHQVADRHHAGNLVYATTRHNRVRLSLSEALVINDLIVESGGKILFLLPPFDYIKTKLQERGEYWERLQDEYSRFGFIAEHMYHYHPGQIWIVDTIPTDQRNQLITRWVVKGMK